MVLVILAFAQYSAQVLERLVRQSAHTHASHVLCAGGLLHSEILACASSMSRVVDGLREVHERVHATDGCKSLSLRTTIQNAKINFVGFGLEPNTENRIRVCWNAQALKMCHYGRRIVHPSITGRLPFWVANSLRSKNN